MGPRERERRETPEPWDLASRPGSPGGREPGFPKRTSAAAQPRAVPAAQGIRATGRRAPHAPHHAETEEMETDCAAAPYIGGVSPPSPPTCQTISRSTS